MGGYTIRLHRLPGESVRVDRKAQRSGKYETAGWTTDDVLRERLGTKGWDEPKIANLLSSLSESRPQEVEFAASDFESYQAFQGFWSAGVPPKDHPKLFVCYAGEDHDVARAVAAALRTGKGIDVWYAPWEILAGGSVVGGIEKGLTVAQHIAVFLSPDSIKKAWPTAEREAATVRMIEDGANLIPVNLDLSTKEMPALLRARKWVTMSGTDSNAVAAAVNEISASVYGQTERPALGPMPEFVETPAPTLPGHDVTQIDRVVLALLFELGKEEPLFQIGFETLVVAAEAKQIDPEQLDDSLELLREIGFVRFQRAIGGAIPMIEVTNYAVELCCRELIPNYSERKRRILAEVVNANRNATTNEEIVAQTGEEPWLVGHVLRDAEDRSLLKLQPVYVGAPFMRYTVYGITARLKRDLQDPETDI